MCHHPARETVVPEKMPDFQRRKIKACNNSFNFNLLLDNLINTKNCPWIGVPYFFHILYKGFDRSPGGKRQSGSRQGGSKTFFAETDRSTLPRLTPHSNVGYGGPGNEALNARRAADLKEVFNVRKETLTETWMKAVCLFFCFAARCFGLVAWCMGSEHGSLQDASQILLQGRWNYLFQSVSWLVICFLILAFNCLFPTSRGFQTIPRMAHWHFTTASLATVRRCGIYVPVQHSVHCWHLAQLCNWMIQQPLFLFESSGETEGWDVFKSPWRLEDLYCAGLRFHGWNLWIRQLFPDKSLGQGFFPQNRKRDGLSPTSRVCSCILMGLTFTQLIVKLSKVYNWIGSNCGAPDWMNGFM